MSADALKTEGLSGFENVLRRSFTEREEINQALIPVASQFAKMEARVARWDRGFLFRRWFPKKLEALRASAAELKDQKDELEEQNRLAHLAPELSIPPAVSGAHERLTTAFATMAQSIAIWDTVSERRVDRVVERSAAERAVDRKPVRFDVAPCPLLESLPPVPHLQNANGGDLYLFPAFIVYFLSRDKFALLEYSMVELNPTAVRFHEDGTPIPGDAERGEPTWLKVNKNGKPDLRFRDNREIPTAIYGMLEFRSPQGLREEYMVSNRKSFEAFAQAWGQFVLRVKAGQ